jgi:hypothetical protein
LRITGAGAVSDRGTSRKYVRSSPPECSVADVLPGVALHVNAGPVVVVVVVVAGAEDVVVSRAAAVDELGVSGVADELEQAATSTTANTTATRRPAVTRTSIA